MHLWSISALLLGAQASAQDRWPEPLHIATAVSEDAALPPSVSMKTKEGIETFLNGSEVYALLPHDKATARLGVEPGRIEYQCGTNPSCWERARQRLGVDILLQVEVSTRGTREESTLHLYTAEHTSTSQAQLLPRGGGAPLETLEAMLFQPGTLHIALENGSTHLQVNGEARLLSPTSSVTISDLRPGNHKVLIEGLGLPQRVEVVRILPGQTIDIPINSSPAAAQNRRHRWWGAWTGGALLLGGAIAVLSGSGRDGVGWR